MVVAAFLVTDKANQVKFFEKIFLVANVIPKVVFKMLFLTLSDANIDFLDWELRWRIYTTEKIFPTTKRIKVIRKKEFAAAAIDPEHETYIIHIRSVSSIALPSFSPLNADVHPAHRSQISGLIAEKALIKIPAKDLNFADIFSLNLAFELPEHTKINNHAIKLVDGQ